MSTDHANSLGAMAAGKLLIQVAGGRWGPVILILASIALVQRVVAAKAQRRRRSRPQGTGMAPR